MHTRVKGVLHESLGRGSLGVKVEVRQGSVVESVVDAGSPHRLLAHTGDHLGDIDFGALGATDCRVIYRIYNK
jgi:hypothetical protein